MAANEDAGDARRFSNGLPADATLEDKKMFTTHCAKNYHAQEWYNESVSEHFVNDLWTYTVEDFAAIDSDTRRNLRDLLRHRGVFVPKGGNIIIAQALFQIVQEDLRWTDNDSEKPSDRSPEEKKNQSQHGQPSINNNWFSPRPANKHHQNNSENRDGQTTETEKTNLKNSEFRYQRNGNMAKIFKAYYNDFDKYSDATFDNVERKFMPFLERCDQADIAENERHSAFPIMPIGNARQYYFDTLKLENVDLQALQNIIKDRFQTPELTRSIVREWNSLTFHNIVSINLSKYSSESPEILIEKLSEIQTYRPSEYRNEIILCINFSTVSVMLKNAGSLIINLQILCKVLNPIYTHHWKLLKRETTQNNH